MQCEAHHPDGHGQCIRDVHGDERCHKVEHPDPLRGAQATTVYLWGLNLRPSEFPMGPVPEGPPVIHPSPKHRVRYEPLPSVEGNFHERVPRIPPR